MTDFTALEGLDRPTLIRLAELLEAGLLGAPFTQLTVGDHLPAAHAESVTEWLGTIADPIAHESKMKGVSRRWREARSSDRGAISPRRYTPNGPRWLAEDLGAPEGEEAARDSVAQNVALDAALLPQKLDGYRIWIRVSAEQLATLRATLDV